MKPRSLLIVWIAATFAASIAAGQCGDHGEPCCLDWDGSCDCNGDWSQPYFGICGPCGGEGEPICLDNDPSQCQPGLTNIGGICVACGHEGQFPCGVDCEDGLYPDPPLVGRCSYCAQGNPPYYCNWDGRGQEGEPPFGIGGIEHLRNQSIHLCDRGLSFDGNACVNSTRHSPYVDTFVNSWTYRALRLQREINKHMPLTQGLFAGSHNAFNTDADGYTFYQHTYSLSDQLDLGVRVLGLDVHWFPPLDPIPDLRLSHAFENHAGFSPSDRPYRYAIEEVYFWLQSNPDEIIIFEHENRGDDHAADILPPLRDYFGSWVFGQSDLQAPPFYGAWYNVTPAALLSRGKRVIVMNDGSRVPDDTELVHQDVPYVPGYGTDGDNLVSRFWDEDAGWQYDPETQTSGMHPADFNQFSGDTQNPANPGGEMMNPPAIRAMVRAGVNFISLDPIGDSNGIPTIPQTQDAAALMDAFVWSWAPNEPPVDGLAKGAKLVQIAPSTYRFRSASPSETRRVALRPDPCSPTWTISSTAMTFAQAQSQPGFAVPGNGIDMARLIRAFIAHDIQGEGVWVNYSTTAGAPNTWNSVVLPEAIPTIYVDWVNSSPPFWGTPPNPFSTVLAGVNAATGCVNELRINGGEYPENLTIDRSLTLVPYEGSGIVTIGD